VQLADLTAVIDVQIDSGGTVRKTSSVSGAALLLKAAQEAAMRWRFDSVEAGSCMRSARLIFIFRPISYLLREGESDFTPPYQMAVSWIAVTGSFEK
jgi:hypothetical protein